MTIHASKPSLAELYPFLCLFSFAFFFCSFLLQKDGPLILIPRISKNRYIRAICVFFVLVSLTLETSQEQNAREAKPPHAHCTILTYGTLPYVFGQSAACSVEITMTFASFPL